MKFKPNEINRKCRGKGSKCRRRKDRVRNGDSVETIKVILKIHEKIELKRYAFPITFEGP